MHVTYYFMLWRAIRSFTPTFLNNGFKLQSSVKLNLTFSDLLYTNPIAFIMVQWVCAQMGRNCAHYDTSMKLGAYIYYTPLETS